MADTLYIMHAADEWEDYKYIYGAFSSKERAVADLLFTHPDLIYSESRKVWHHPDPDNSQYFYIEEIHVK